MPQLRWEGGKGAKLRGKVNAVSSSEGRDKAPLTLHPTAVRRTLALPGVDRGGGQVTVTQRLACATRQNYPPIPVEFTCWDSVLNSVYRQTCRT